MDNLLDNRSVNGGHDCFTMLHSITNNHYPFSGTHLIPWRMHRWRIHIHSRKHYTKPNFICERNIIQKWMELDIHKKIALYPAYMVLPAFTNFSVGPPQLNCSKSEESLEQDLTVLTVICYGSIYRR